VDSSVRYFGCAVGFGFGVLWMTEGLGAAILCLLLAGLGYGAVFLGEAITAPAVGGLVLVLAGVALGTGAVRFARRRKPRLACDA